MMMKSLLHTGVFLLIVLSSPSAIQGQFSSAGDCAELQSSDLGNITTESQVGLLADTLRVVGRDGITPSVQILESNVVCLSQGSVKDTYSTVSVVVRYTADGIEYTSQVEYMCDGGVWGFSSLFPAVVNNSLVGTLTSPVRTDCILCTGSTIDIDITEVEHCLGTCMTATA